VAASLREAAAESKEPDELFGSVDLERLMIQPKNPSPMTQDKLIGVLRLRGPIREANRSAALRMTRPATAG